jgi:Fis family transcriptional regulator, factor for inversion stimulation protein
MKDGFDGVMQQLLDSGIFLEQAIEVLEKGMIQGALERSKSNQCAAARLLGIHRNTLQRKMVEYDLVQTSGRARRKPAARAGQVRKKRAVVA